MRIDTRRPGSYQIRSVNFNASRILAHWRNGDVGFASGVDWRSERMNAGTSPEVLSGTELRPAINLINGERDVLAAFAEFELPLFEDFTLNTALRADHYDDFGSAVSPKVAARYLIAEDFLLRGSWSRGFRAPSLPEIAQSNTISYGSVVDPEDPVGPGELRLATTWSRLLEYEQALVAGETPVNGAGNNQFGALPKWKSATSAVWQQGDWQLTTSADFTSSYAQRRVTETSNPGLADSVDSHLTFNAQLAYSGFTNTQLRLSVQNLTDKQPPFDPSAGAYFYDMTQYNARGRVINLAATYTF